jgi:hypothetical protein
MLFSSATVRQVAQVFSGLLLVALDFPGSGADVGLPVAELLEPASGP